MKELPIAALALIMIAAAFVNIPATGETDALIPKELIINIHIKGLTLTTSATAIYQNNGEESIVYPFRVGSIPGTFITGLEIDGIQAYLAESLYDRNSGPASDGKSEGEDPRSGGDETETDPMGNHEFWILIPPESEVEVTVKMESRLHMKNGSYDLEIPLDIVRDHSNFESCSILLTGGMDNYDIGRRISLDHDSIQLGYIRSLIDGESRGVSEYEPMEGDVIKGKLVLDELEGWFQAYIESSSTSGYYLVAISPERNGTGTSKVLEYDTNIDVGGIIEEDAESIVAGEEGVLAGVYKTAFGDLSMTLEMGSSNGTYTHHIEKGVADVHEVDWVSRYWELSWMEFLLVTAMENNGANGSRNDVIDFSIDRSILSPYTRFELPPPPVDDDFSDEQELVGGDPGDRSGLAVNEETSGDPWNQWEDYWSKVEPDEYTYSKHADEPNFLEEYWMLIAGSAAVIIVAAAVALIYSRLREDDLLKQENRKKIYDYIMKNKGAHFREIQRGVDLEVGTLSHHLNILEKEQLIISEQDGNNRRFYIAGVQRETGKIRLSRIQENILKEIQAEPGITQVQIAKRLGVSRKVVFYHVKFLASSDMVTEEKVKRRAHYYPTD